MSLTSSLTSLHDTRCSDTIPVSKAQLHQSDLKRNRPVKLNGLRRPTKSQSLKLRKQQSCPIPKFEERVTISGSLMDIRTCTINADEKPRLVSVHRQSSFTRKAASLKRFSFFASDSPTYSNGQVQINIVDYLSTCSEYITSNDNWKLQSIPSSWKEIMDTNNLNEELIDQQVAIWELIQTEHCFLSQLAVIKNVFIYCLDSLREANLLATKETNYYNIFGNVDELYFSHLCFWKKTLLPSLQKALLHHIPISLTDLVHRFPNCKELFSVHEEYCLSHNTNLQVLDKAMQNPEFKAYIKWCEARPECKRLHLKDFLAKPMQRITKYPLLLKAILKKTVNNDVKGQLIVIMVEMEKVVQSINLAVHHQEELEKVKEMARRITSYNMGDFPRGWDEFLHPYMQLDLTAPMVGIDTIHHRKLLLDGMLRYKDSFSKVDTCVFLFTDLLLITKLLKKGSEQLVIYKPPFRVDQLLLKEGSNPACFNVIYVSELRTPILWFNLRAASPHAASGWMKKIQQAQKQYVILTKKGRLSTSDASATHLSNGSETSLSTFDDDEDIDIVSPPDTPKLDSIPLVQVSHCEDDDDMSDDTEYRHKSHRSYVLTPSCSTSSLIVTTPRSVADVSTQTTDCLRQSKITMV